MANEAIDGEDSDFEMRVINREVTALCGFHRANLWLGSTIFISDQAILWHYQKCSEDTNMDCSFGLRLGRHREETAQC